MSEAAMSTTLTQFNDVSNARTYTAPGHTIPLPKQVIQRRKAAAGAVMVSESSIRVVFGSKDAEGVPLAERISFEVVVRVPLKAQTDDVNAAKALFREIVDSTNFSTVVSTQNYVQ